MLGRYNPQSQREEEEGGDGSPDFSALDWEWETGSGQEEQLIEEGETIRNRAGLVHFEQSNI